MKNSTITSKLRKVINKVRHTLELIKGTHEQREMLHYMYYEMREMRSKIRYLLGDDANLLPLCTQTRQSFDFQWDKLTEGKDLLSNQAFRNQVTDLISQFTELDKSWFKDKTVLDAGCGQGRFTFGFAALGAKTTALDQSTEGLAYAKNALGELTSQVEFLQHNLLEPLTLSREFDMVWSFGVLHHTGNTYKAFNHIHPLVKKGGYLFLMLYGEPVLGDIASFQEQAEYTRLRQITRSKTFEEKQSILKMEKKGQDLHGWFDAISPTINDTYSFEEIEGWLINAGFTDIKITSTSTNHHVVAMKA
jgi:SAM-dependent methyltransferase